MMYLYLSVALLFNNYIKFYSLIQEFFSMYCSSFQGYLFSKLYDITKKFYFLMFLWLFCGFFCYHPLQLAWSFV